MWKKNDIKHHFIIMYQYNIVVQRKAWSSFDNNEEHSYDCMQIVSKPLHSIQYTRKRSGLNYACDIIQYIYSFYSFAEKMVSVRIYKNWINGQLLKIPMDSPFVL